MATAKATDVQQIGARASGGIITYGEHREVISGSGATRTLLTNESGALCLFDRAAGITFTLPAAVAGITFDFMPTIKTTGSYKIICASGDFLLGTIFGYTTDVTEIDGFVADGTADLAIASNGTTTGGDAGGRYSVTAISGTQWMITGNVYCGTATPSTPIATS